MRRAAVACTLAAALLGGCSHTDAWSFPLRVVDRRPSRVAPALVLRGAPAPGRPFVEIALVQARSDDGLEGAMRALAARAAALGADAVLDVRVDEGATDLSVIGTAVAWTAGAP
jgi:hypothetical protein